MLRSSLKNLGKPNAPLFLKITAHTVLWDSHVSFVFEILFHAGSHLLKWVLSPPIISNAHTYKYKYINMMLLIQLQSGG